MKIILNITIYLIATFQLIGQSTHFEVDLEPIVIKNLGGIQSYAVGTYDGEWLIIGGRLDGLHRRRPFASFSPDGNNQEIIVVNPDSKQVWKISLSSLPTKLKEQLASTNMQFVQSDDRLILTGGYGYSPSQDEHITFPYLTVVDIPAVMAEIKQGKISSDNFYQIEDESFQVAGGRLAQIDDVFYLVGGHKFMGRYNPMGPDHGPGFVQEYTHEIRKFNLNISEDYKLDFLTPQHDEMHLRRRDYNLVPYIENGKKGLMAYSGVFQTNADLPWLYPVKIDANEYEPVEDFVQYFNHYHCATLPIYDAEENEMHTLFFGGIAQFYMDEENIMVQDNDVPFVNTITDVSRSKTEELNETVLKTKMPGYLGAGSEFMFSPEAKFYDDGILSGDAIDEEFTQVGYIYGGIRSSLPHIFWINEGAESEASNTIYKVSIRKRKTSGTVSEKGKNEKVFFYPNPDQKKVRMSIELDNAEDFLVEIYNTNGSKIHSQKISEPMVHSGKNLLILDDVNIEYGAFIYKVSYGDSKVIRKVIWAE